MGRRPHSPAPTARIKPAHCNAAHSPPPLQPLSRQGVASSFLFVTGLTMLACVARCYQAPEKDGNSMYEFGVNHHPANQTDSISL
jgi:hypothetical protein